MTSTSCIKNNGDFEMKALLKRIRLLREEEKEKEK